MRILATVSLFGALFLFSASPCPIQGQSQTLRDGEDRRSLPSFKETSGNASFQCSPSGPCVACQYSEKGANGKKFQKRRSALEDDTKISSYVHPNVNRTLQDARERATAVRHFEWRKLLGASFTPEGGKKTYITYRSCLPVVLS